MIYINNIWEMCESLQDVSKIIREYYNCELADKLDEFIKEENELLDYKTQCQLECKDDRISELEDVISELEDDLSYYAKLIDKLSDENKVLKM